MRTRRPTFRLRALRDPTIALRVLFVATVALVLGPLGGALHRASVDHEFCARHGVIEHVHAGASTGIEVDPQTPPTSPAPRHDHPAPSDPTQPSDRGDTESHDPCTMPLAVAFDRAALPDFAPSLVLRNSSVPAASVPPAARPSVAILRFAPKTSPPSLS